MDKERLKLGTKESYFLGGEGEGHDAPEGVREASEEPDLDEAMLDAADVDSDDGDWRNAAAESSDDGEFRHPPPPTSGWFAHETELRMSVLIVGIK